MPSMRTTVTLDADTESLLRDAMRQREQTFKQGLNDAVRRGLAGLAGDPERPPFVQRTFPMRLRAGCSEWTAHPVTRLLLPGEDHVT